jgi:hypothetical protein
MGPLVEGRRADEVAQWGARPRAAFVVKALAVLTPVVASVMATIAVTKIVPRPTNVIALVAWWVGLTAMATLVAVLVERVARRLLPLASLLRLSAAFPDEAPSRFAVVLRTHSATQLEATLDHARVTGEQIDDAPAAEYLLELLVRLNTHDRWTRGHADRVSAYAELIAVELGLPEPVREQLRWSALLHDIGKLDLPAGLLNLARRPTAIERRALERHVTEGEALTRSMAGWLGDSLRAVSEHHERWDGDGYPRQLAGEQISLAARIVAVADAFDAMTGAKTYQERVSAVEARSELTRGAGAQFDPNVVRAFLNVSLGRLRLVMGPLTWVSNVPVLSNLPVAAGLSAVASTVAVTGLIVGSQAAVTAETPTDDVVEFVAVDDDSPATTIPRTTRTTVLQGDERPSDDDQPDDDQPDDDQPDGDPPPGDPPPDDGPPTDDEPPPPPIAPDLTFSITEDSLLTATLAPDTEVADVDDPAHGTVTRLSDNRFSYQPPNDWNGTVRFGYRRCDHGCSTALITVRVLAVNDEPVLRSAPDQAIPEDAGPQTVDGWVSVDPGPPDESAQQSTIDTTTDDPALFAAGPTVRPDGTLTYTPAPDANGTATLHLTATDDGGTARGGDDTSRTRSATITIQAVNDAAVAVDDPVEIDEDAVGVTIDVLANDTDTDGDPLVLWAFDQDMLEAGTLTASGSSLTYTPDPDINGTDTFDYWITDGSGAFDRATVTISIRPMPDAPVANADAYATPEATALTVARPGLLGNDSDVDGDDLTVDPTPVIPPTHGALAVQPDGGFTYTPEAGFAGKDTFAYRIDDGTGRSAIATVSITVEDDLTERGCYLGGTGAGPDDWFLLDDPLPPSDPAADYDGDGDQGLTIKKREGDLDDEYDDDGRRFQHWQLIPSAPLVVSGPVRLELWAALRGFRDEEHPITASVWLQDCRDDGTDCRGLLRTDIDVEDWDRGTDDFVRHDLDLGPLSTTVAPGRMLRMRLMFDHQDMWVALTDAQRSRLVLTLG